MLNPLKWKYESQVGLLVSAIAGAGFGILIGYRSGNGLLGTLILGADQRCHSRRGVLSWSGLSVAAHALPSSPRLPSLAWRGANELTPRCYLGPDGQCDSSSSTREQGSHDASSDDAGDDSTRLA